MVDALDLPALIKTPTGYSFDPIEALGLTLAHFRTAGDQYEFSMIYNCSQLVMCWAGLQALSPMSPARSSPAKARP